MSSRPLSLLLLLASLLLWSHTSIHAEQPLLLQRIEVHTSGSVEQVALKFSKAFREDPLINFDSGSMSLRLPHTRLDPSVPPLISPASNPLIRTIRATHADSGDYVRVDLHFRQDRRLRGNPEITYSTDQISLSLNHRPAATELPLVESSRLLEQAEQKLQEGDRFTSTFSRTEAAGAEPLTDGFPTPVYADDDWVRTLLSLVLALLFILLLIFLLAWFYNRFLAGRFPASRGKVQIRLVSTFHVAPRQKVVVLEINGQQFACGVTPTAISLISAIPSGQAAKTAETGKLGADASKTDRSRLDFLKALDTARLQSQEMLKQSPPKPQATLSSEVALAPETEADSAAVVEKPVKSSKRTARRKGYKPTLRPAADTGAKGWQQDLRDNPAMEEFASKLSRRLKSLKPIK